MIRIELLSAENFKQDSLDNYSRKQDVKKVYRKRNGEYILVDCFYVANDGGNVHPDLWQVTWRENCVEAVISGEEQNDNQYIIYFNGGKDSNQLETRYGRP